MNTQEYSQKAIRTMAKLTKDTDNLHMILGMVTETGELADVFKKNMAYKKEIDWVNVKEEVGDLMWYIINFCSINGFDLEEIMETNIKKLETRYPEKFTEENAINRNLQEERKILETGL